MNKLFYNLLAKILAIPAKIIINRFQPKIIGVTGSAGKTSTKEAIYEVLERSSKYQGKVVKAYGGLNTEVGMPLAILGIKDAGYRFGWFWIILRAKLNCLKFLLIKKYPEILVLEFSVDKPGDMKYLTSLARPDIAVITQIGAAHLHTFKNIENVAHEKMELARQLKPDGIAILNEDNPYIKKAAKKIYFEKRWFHGDEFGSAKNSARIVAEIFKIDKKEVDQILANLKIVKGRLNVFRGIKNTTLIDDTYNSNPLSAKRALKFLKTFKSNPSAEFILNKAERLRARKIAILGDMRELGDATKIEHQKLAKITAKVADFTITIGPEMQKYAEPIFTKLKHPHQSFLTVKDAKDEILKTIKGKEVILIKASQNTLFLERVTEMLLANKKEINNLCRQSKNWLKIKRNTL